jgi:carbonic anhydrase
VPEELYTTHEIDLPIGELNLLPERRDHYRYKGSLTTPSCTEGLTWLIRKEPAAMSSVQVDRFVDLTSADARPNQPRNDRRVME